MEATIPIPICSIASSLDIQFSEHRKQHFGKFLDLFHLLKWLVGCLNTSFKAMISSIINYRIHEVSKPHWKFRVPATKTV